MKKRRWVMLFDDELDLEELLKLNNEEADTPPNN